MAELSMPWTANATGDGRAYTALEFSTFLRYLLLGGHETTDGVVKGALNELAVTGTSSPVAVNTGAAVVYGKLYHNDASKNVTVSTPSVGTTGGHIVVQLDWVAQTVRVVSVRNTDGVSAIPALVQSVSTQWEVELATYTITTGGVITLTDTRNYATYGQVVETANIKDLAATTAKINDAAITTVKIADVNVTTGKLADNAVTTAKITDANVTTAKIADVNVTTGKIADNAVDDTKAGDRVPQFYRRQGGSATDWSTAGNTTQTPAAVRVQHGAKSVTINSGTNSGTAVVTLPVAFSVKPHIQCTIVDDNGGPYIASAIQTGLSASGFTINVQYAPGTGSPSTLTLTVHWTATATE